MTGFRLGGTTRPKLTVAVDVDGVLTLAPYTGRTAIDGPPRDGAIAWLTALLTDPRLDVFLFTTRACEPTTRTLVERSVRNWLAEEGLARDLADRLPVIGHKAPAHVYIDDRGWRFDGTYPSVEDIVAFRPWWDHMFPEITP